MKEDLLDTPVIVEGYPTGESRYAIGPDGSTAEWYLSFEVTRVFKGQLRSELIEVLQNSHYPLETTRPQDATYILFLDVYEKSDPVVYSYESNWCLYRSDETSTAPVYDMYSDIRSWTNFLEVDGSPSTLSDWLASRVGN